MNFILKNNSSKLIRNIAETKLIILTSMIAVINEFIVVFSVCVFVIIFKLKFL